MGLGNQRTTTIRNGEFLAAAGQTYVSGSPAAIDKAGQLRLATNAAINLARTDPSALSYIGLFVRTSGFDAVRGKGEAPVYMGPTIVTLQKNVNNINNSSLNNDGAPGNQPGDDYPYDATLAWDEADRLFIGATGKWQRTAATGGDPHYGTVLKVGPNFLTVLLYGGPCA